MNESSYARFRINQKIQTQSVNFSSVNSPNSFRSPTSGPSRRTPRRRLDCQANDLNFGPEAECKYIFYFIDEILQSSYLLHYTTSLYSA